MAILEAVAFKWTGTWYNTIYDTSYKLVLRDDDTAFEGSGDADETISIDGGEPLQSYGSPYAIDVDFKDANGEPHLETFYFLNAGGDWYFIPGKDSAFSEGATLGMYQSHTVGWDHSAVVCFADGTLIETASGAVPVERLTSGDMILTLDGGLRPLRINMARAISTRTLKAHPKLRPVKITAGALGQGLPTEDLWVSRQHRMLVSSSIAEKMFGVSEVLLPAIRLTECPGCFVDDERSSVSYHHLVFDRHEVVFSNGAPSESLYPGPEALKTITEESKAEFLEIFSAQMTGQAVVEHARLVPERRLQKMLVERHLAKDRPLIMAPFVPDLATATVA